MKGDTNISLAKADHNTIMRREGYFVGYYGSSTADELVDDIREKLVDQWCKAKGLSVVFYHCDDDISEDIGQITDEIESLVSEDTNMVFCSEIDDRVSAGVLEYEVLLSGIEAYKG